MLANQFTEAFHEEHRQMRDMLLGLMNAIETNDVESVRRGIEETAAHAGPHFHYEEQVLYPALAEIYGDDYVARLAAEHDAALEAVRELAELAEAEDIHGRRNMDLNSSVDSSRTSAIATGLQ